MKPFHKNILILAGVVILLIGGIAFWPKSQNQQQHAHKDIYYCPMHPNYTSDKPGVCPICQMKLEKRETTKKILYWTDTMIPGYKASGPGKSPMGMDLVPVYEEEAQGLPSNSPASPPGYVPILMTPQKAQLIGIKTASVVRKKITKTIRAVGTIAHDPELYQAQAEYIQAIQAYQRAQASSIPEIVDQSKRLVESSWIRLKHFGLSDELIEEISTWKEPEHSLLFAHPGQMVWMYSEIYEYELPLVKVGQELSVAAPSLPGEHLPGVIRAIDQMVDHTTRTTRIRAKLNDPDGHLKPAMYVNVNILIDLDETLTVPQEAVFNTGTKQIVFVDQGKGALEPREVTVGVKTENDVQIQSGLSEGEMVVTSGNFLIDSESRLKAAIEGGAHGQ